MARIRSIHPGLFTDEDYMSLTPYAMAAWPGMWVEADDNGVFEWKPLTLKARLLPCAPVDMVQIIGEYEACGMVRRFDVEGKTYGAIRNFRKFQRPEKPKSWHPLPDDMRSHVGLSEHHRQPIPDQSPTAPRKSPQMEDGGGKVEKELSDASASERAREAKPAPVFVPMPANDPRGSRLSRDWQLPDDWREWAEHLGMPPPLIANEADKFRDFWIGKPGAAGRKSDWAGTWRNWCRRVMEPKHGQRTQHDRRGAGGILAAVADLEAADRRRADFGDGG